MFWVWFLKKYFCFFCLYSYGRYRSMADKICIIFPLINAMGRSLLGVKWSLSLLSFANEDLLRHKYNIDHQPKSNLVNGLHFVEELRFLPLILEFTLLMNHTDDGFLLLNYFFLNNRSQMFKLQDFKDD